ncbi:TIGR02530 family flagellar biosynthesis protein [Halobacteriovorax sp. HLS]|uniref:TIGR02530 family flagellar biosynthesis protein n=1 Tax=Halobacteriovorax sp. HLS TaxID=2234000 RepID=UPI000FD7B0F4|nr:TIGR02530 family flagellar biosynthesis protein [Halobacteriovorax sp. HLS]
MTKGNINNILIPNVSKIPSNKKVNVDNRIDGAKSGEEFKALLQDQVTQTKKEHGIHLSTHAAKRLHERNLTMDSDEFFKLKDAMVKLKDKGGQDSLVITDKAAYIVDVPNNKIVTAIDKGSILDNVFTKIDSTVIV